jgi:ribosome biogenesis GTPase
VPDTTKGIVVAAKGRLFIIETESGDRISCDVRGNVKKDSDKTTPVAVGDDVVISFTHDGGGIIEEVGTRRTAFFRPQMEVKGVRQVIAANLDYLAVVGSIKTPPLKDALIDRFLIAGQMGNLKPCVIINKIDLEKDDEHKNVIDAYAAVGFPTFAVSAASGSGMGALREFLKDRRTLFAGLSGVGKSTILNALIPGISQKTDGVSQYSNKGKHTTTNIELFPLPDGGYIIDSPGIKVMRFSELTDEELQDYYPEFDQYRESCRFQPCSHNKEPNCGVKTALERGEISRFRYENYVTILESL